MTTTVSYSVQPVPQFAVVKYTHHEEPNGASGGAVEIVGQFADADTANAVISALEKV